MSMTQFSFNDEIKIEQISASDQSSNMPWVINLQKFLRTLLRCRNLQKSLIFISELNGLPESHPTAKELKNFKIATIWERPIGTRFSRLVNTDLVEQDLYSLIILMMQKMKLCFIMMSNILLNIRENTHSGTEKSSKITI